MAFLAGNAAFGLLRHIAGEAEILTLAVLPEQRKKGMGEALVHAMVLWAQEQHIRSMFLEVDECNEVARKLYEKKGFLVISKRNEYYQNTDGTLSHALVMKLILS